MKTFAKFAVSFAFGFCLAAVSPPSNPPIGQRVTIVFENGYEREYSASDLSVSGDTITFMTKQGAFVFLKSRISGWAVQP